MAENFAVEMYHAGDGQRQDYVEIWSGYPYGGNIVKPIKHRGGREIGFGLSAGYDLELDATKQSARQQLEHQRKPKTLMLCPRCTGSGSRCNLAAERRLPLRTELSRRPMLGTPPYSSRTSAGVAAELRSNILGVRSFCARSRRRTYLDAGTWAS